MSCQPEIFFPRELQDLILDQLDTPSLGALTVLSRHNQWRELARERVLSTIRTHDKLKDQTHSIAALHVVLDSPTDLGRFIRELIVAGEVGHDVEVDSRQLGRIVGGLPLLESLRLRNVWLKTIPASSTSSGSDAIKKKHLRNLSLWGMYFGLEVEGVSRTSLSQDHEIIPSTQCSFTELFTIFTGLETLELYSAQFIWHSALEDQERVDLSAIAAAEAAKIPLTSHLKQLLLRTGLPDPYTLFVLQILSRSCILHGLQSFNVYHTVPIGEFNGLMGTFGQNLRTLNLTMPWFCVGNHNYDTSPCKSLAHLRLSTSIFANDREFEQIAAIQESILNTPPTLQHLEIELRYCLPWQTVGDAIDFKDWKIDWKAVELNLSQRSELNSVDIILIADGWQPSLHDSDGPTLRDEAERIRDSLMMLKNKLGDRLRMKVVCNCNTICAKEILASRMVDGLWHSEYFTLYNEALDLIIG